jgi:hypothetical protein
MPKETLGHFHAHARPALVDVQQLGRKEGVLVRERTAQYG